MSFYGYLREPCGQHGVFESGTRSGPVQLKYICLSLAPSRDPVSSPDKIWFVHMNHPEQTYPTDPDRVNQSPTNKLCYARAVYVCVCVFLFVPLDS